MSGARHRAQDGFVLVVTMVVMAFVLSVAAYALAEAQNGRAVTTRDQRQDRALQAAEAGAQAAAYRLNQINLAAVNFSGGLNALSQAVACQTLLSLNLSAAGTVPTLGVADVSAGTGTCGSGRPGVPTGLPLFDEDLGNRQHATAYALVGPTSTNTIPSAIGAGTLNPVVVSVGRDTNGTATTTDDVVRRVKLVLEPVDPFSGLEATGNLTFNQSGLTGLVASVTTLNGNAQADGNLNLQGGLLHTFVNANISLAPLGVTGSVQYQGAYSHGALAVNLSTFQQVSSPPVTRTPVSVSPAKPDCAAGCPAGYDAATHSLVPTSGTVTIAGGDYVFCRLTVPSGVTIRPAPASGIPVRIFIDSPSSARCSGVGGAGNISFGGRLDPGVSLQPSQFQLYAVGNGAATPRSTATFDFSTNLLSSLLPGFFFYGPTTDVTVKYTTFQGTIVGHDITMTQTSLTGTITQDLAVNQLALTPALSVMRRKQYVDCGATDVPTPLTATSGC